MKIENLCARRVFGDVVAASNGSRMAIKGGYLHQTASGIYTLSNLGLRVQKKVEKIIQEEMELVGAQEIKMPVVSNADLWKLTYGSCPDVTMRSMF